MGRNMKKIGSLIVILYVVVAIFVTICLLTYNQYKVSVFGDKTLVIIDKDEKNLNYKKGDLVIVGLEGYENAVEGDVLFFYKDNGIKIAEIKQKNDYGDAGVTFTIDGNYQVVHEDVIGISSNEKVIPKVGGVLKLLESKWGFLFLIVFPSMLAFLREIRELIMELMKKK
jgi:hypothetical protein